MVSINIMSDTTQVNVRLDNVFLNKAKKYAQKNGFSSIQDLVKETLREKIYLDDTLTPEEYAFVKKVIDVTNKKNLWGTEKELFTKLNRK